MKKALILIESGIQTHEWIYPYYRLQEAGYQVDAVSPDGQTKIDKHGIPFKYVTHSQNDFVVDTKNSIVVNTELVAEYNILYCPGGYQNVELICLNKKMLQIIQEFDRQNKVILSVCHGASCLICAKVTKGRIVLGYDDIQVPIENSGAIYPDLRVVRDKNWVSGRHYKDLPSLMALVLTTAEELFPEV